MRRNWYNNNRDNNWNRGRWNNQEEFNNQNNDLNQNWNHNLNNRQNRRWENVEENNNRNNGLLPPVGAPPLPNLNINEENPNFLRRVKINEEEQKRPDEDDDASSVDTNNFQDPSQPMSIERAKAILSVPDTPTNDMGPEVRGRVEQQLIRCFFENWKKMENKPSGTEKEFIQYIRKLLIDNEAVIAGGFILKTIGAFKDNWYSESIDIDIYVPCRKLKPFNLIWAKLLGAKKVAQFAASIYCVSFLRKNGIRSVQKLLSKEKEYVSYGKETNTDKDCQVIEVDIMAVRNKRKVLDVVQNFDLTFCQIWYDGRTVSATHPTHIKQRVGYLQKDYVPLFVKGNIFLKNRIRKYKYRGYRVLLDPKCGSAFENIDTGGYYSMANNKPEPHPKDEAYYKRWAAHALLSLFLTGTYKSENTEFGGYLRRATNMQLIDPKDHDLDEVYRKSTKAIKHGVPIGDLNTIQYLDPTDGYDSEDLDISDKTTFYPAIRGGFADGKFPDRPDLSEQDEESKFHHLVFDMYSKLISPFPEESTYFNHGSTYHLYNRDEDKKKGTTRTDYRMPDTMADILKHLEKFTNTIKSLTTNVQMDPVTLEDAEVYYLHEHKLEDSFTKDAFVTYLNKPDLVNRTDKSAIKCYVPDCPYTLKMSEIHAIVPAEFYETFASYKPPNPDPLLENSTLYNITINKSAMQTKENLEAIKAISSGVTDIFQNTPSTDTKYGNLYHAVMCPFCLQYMKRLEGCIYVAHSNPDNKYTVLPYCKPQNIVNDIVKKYNTAARRRDDGYVNLEVCAECGRPSNGHKHFTVSDNPKLITDYTYKACKGGGRREMIARILAVRKTMRENPDMDPIEVRRLAAIAADNVMNNADLLAKADKIMALPPKQRHMSQMDEVLDGNEPTPYIEPTEQVPGVAANANSEMPIGAIGNVFEGIEAPRAANANAEQPIGAIGNVFQGGSIPIGKPYTCIHGYTSGYKEKIQHTRKHRKN